jgi:HPt (histidine-containing phosphotransfer) domain-containing protein
MSGCRVEHRQGDGTFPEHLAGVDIPLGLALLSGNQALYLSLLHKFVAGHRDAAAAIRRALSADEWAIAGMIAHGTKGVSACIGATTLQECSAALERAIATQSYEMDSLLHRFEAALSEVVNGLQGKLPSAQDLPSLEP